MKIVGNTIELRPMLETDTQALANCWVGLRPAIAGATEQANFYFESTKWVDKFTSAFNIRIVVTLVVHHKADNKPIGYTVFSSQPDLKHVVNDFTIIDPSYRSKGLFLELNILKHRFIYNSSTPIETSQTKILKGKEHCLTGLYTNIVGELEINPHGIYEVATCTKEQWTSWFNASSYTNNYYEVI